MTALGTLDEFEAWNCEGGGEFGEPCRFSGLAAGDGIRGAPPSSFTVTHPSDRIAALGQGDASIGAGWSLDLAFEGGALFPVHASSVDNGSKTFGFDVYNKIDNGNTTFHAGGREFKAATDWAKSLVQKVPGVFAEQLGYVVGLRYGFMSGWQDLVQGMDDLVHGRVDLGAMIGGIGKVFDPRAWGQMYDAARLDYMKTFAMAADPYTPTPEDLADLATDGGIFWMLDDGAGQTNSSNWLRFAKGNWDGLKWS